MTSFLSNREIYERVACGTVPQAKERLWIATFASAEGVGLPDECNEKPCEARSQEA